MSKVLHITNKSFNTQVAMGISPPFAVLQRRSNPILFIIKFWLKYNFKGKLRLKKNPKNFHLVRNPEKIQ